MKDKTLIEIVAFILLIGIGVVVSCLEFKVRRLEWKVETLESAIEIMTKPIAISEWIASSTNRVVITRDPIDNMPMYSVEMNGGLTR